MDAPKPAPIFRARVDEQGKLVPREVGRWAGYLARFKGRDVEVIVRVERKHRSLKANAYLWSVVYAAAAEWSGHEPKELHQVLKRMFLPPHKLVLPTGEEIEAPGSTRELDTEQFGLYVNKVVRWLAEQGVHVPASSEVA